MECSNKDGVEINGKQNSDLNLRITNDKINQVLYTRFITVKLLVDLRISRFGDLQNSCG